MATLLALVCLLVINHVTEARLTVGAFNIQRLSDGKTEDPTIIKEIAQILVRFDVATIEEVIHTSALDLVMAEVNRIGSGPYSVTVSQALGRTSYREHMAIMYRSDKLSLLKTTTYPDSEDAFEREPYSALFHTIDCSVNSLGVMGVHLKPNDVRVEMDALIHAFENASGVFQSQSFVIAGDFNADCRYLSNRAYENSQMFVDSRFHFLVNKGADSTASHNTDCAYDRFVATGLVKYAAVSGSVQVYNFENDMHLSYDQALAISDHYPIQMELQ